MRRDVAGCLDSIERTDEGYRARFTFPGDLAVFEGHFPGYPLVPGVFLLEAVRTAAERALDRPLRIRRIDDAKFTAEVRPGETVAVDANISDVDAGWRCDASLRSDTGAVASVRLLLAAD